MFCHENRMIEEEEPAHYIYLHTGIEVGTFIFIHFEQSKRDEKNKCKRDRMKCVCKVNVM